MTSLAVIVPTRGRPRAVGALAQAFVVTGAQATLVFGVDEDDPCLPDYRAAVAELRVGFPVDLVVGPRLRMIGTLNAIAVSYADWFDTLGFMGDDHRPRTEGWDREITEVLGAGGPRIVYGNDLYQREQMATAVFLTADIVAALGYMAPPTLLHLKADQVWVGWGAAIDRLTYLPEVIVEHVHPWAGKGDWDPGYEEANGGPTSSHDAEAYWAYMNDGSFHHDVACLQALPMEKR